jgi:hypothetical protein
MTSCIRYILPVLIGICLLISGVSAVPTSAAATGITSNGFNVSVSGCAASGEVAIIYGLAPNAETWISGNYTASGGNVVIPVWGAPILGNSVYYAKACDDTGCGNEITFTTAAITPIPTTTFGAGFKNLTQSHFNIMFIAPAFLQAYFNITGTSLFFGLLFGMITLGMWRRNRGIRLVSVTMIILSPLIMASNIGLMFGIPPIMQSIGQALLAAGVAGVLLSFVKR